jgi:hypothetical protein
MSNRMTTPDRETLDLEALREKVEGAVRTVPDVYCAWTSSRDVLELLNRLETAENRLEVLMRVIVKYDEATFFRGSYDDGDQYEWIIEARSQDQARSLEFYASGETFISAIDEAVRQQPSVHGEG